MDFRPLNALVAVADHGTFSAAARALHTVQSNVSAHVARLEQELGVVLIDRVTGQLTEEGHVVVERTRRVQAEVEAMVADVASMGDVVSGNVRIGMIGTVGRWLAPRLVDAVHREHPLVRLVIVDATTTSLVPRVQQADLDLAIVNTPSDEPGLVTVPLFDEDRVLIAPTDHPLAAFDHVSLATVAEHDLLLSPRGTSFRDELDGAAARLGISLSAHAEVDGMRLLASLAFQGYGAAIVPAGAAPSYVGGDWTLVAIDELLPRSVGLIRQAKARLTRPTRAVQDQVLAVVAEQLGSRAGIHATAGGPEPTSALDRP